MSCYCDVVQLNFKYYLVKTKPIYGSHYSRVKKEAMKYIREIENTTKRKPYIRSKYFHKEKIFISLFISHLFDKRQKERVRRLKLTPCAIELIKSSKNHPTKKMIKGISYIDSIGLPNTNRNLLFKLKKTIEVKNIGCQFILKNRSVIHFASYIPAEFISLSLVNSGSVI